MFGSSLNTKKVGEGLQECTCVEVPEEDIKLVTDIRAGAIATGHEVTVEWEEPQNAYYACGAVVTIKPPLEEGELQRLLKKGHEHPRSDWAS